MNAQNNIQDELRSLNSNLPLGNGQNPFSVPHGYFEGLPASILAQVKGQEETASEEIKNLSPLVAGISKNMPFAVPPDYFGSTLKELPVLIHEDEESDLLSLINKQMPFAVPVGFFENLPAQLVKKVAETKPKVIPLFKRTWMRMAVAATVAGIISFSGYVYFNGQKNTDANAGAPIAKQLKNVSTKELDEFIKNTDVPVTSADLTAARSDVKKMLTGVSDKELDAFLKQVPTDDEDLYVIN